MDKSQVVQLELLRNLPLPLGQLVRKCINATNLHSRHSMAFYLWQSGLQLLASSCVVEFEASGRDGDSPDCLKGLACPSTGHFQRIVRDLLPALAQCDDAKFASIARFFESPIAPEFASLSSLAVSIHEHVRLTRQNKVKRRTRFSPKDLLEDLVTYRNDEFGHGAVGARKDEFYEKMSTLLLSGAMELWSNFSPTLGNRLLYVSSIHASEEGNWIVDMAELIGDQRRQLSPLSIPSKAIGSLPLPNKVYLCPKDGEHFLSLVSSWKSLHPLVIFEPETQDVFYLRGRHGKADVSYISFVSGEHARKVVVHEHRELLAKVLGFEVQQEQLDNWAQQSVSESNEKDEAKPTECKTLGEFELISKIGSGGMGVVYRAFQPSLGRFVAVKKLHQIGDDKARKRFQREIRALGQVDHRNLVKVFSSGTDEGCDFFSMELLIGTDLERVIAVLRDSNPSEITSDKWVAAVCSACETARLEEDSVSTISENNSSIADISKMSASINRAVLHGRTARGHISLVAELIRQVADATQALHEAGIVHRDIKPGNILITQTGQAVLTDLGLAQMSQEKTITATRQFVGTIRYSSPEQVYDSSRVDSRSDVYSLGATLWELLTLQPFLGLTKDVPTAVQFDRVRRATVELPKKYNPIVPNDLSTIVMKAVSRDETQRYRTAGEFAEDLGRWLNGDPVVAQPPSLGYFLRKYAWRYKSALAAFFALAILTAIGVIAAFVSIQRESNRRQQALDENQRLLALNHLQLGSSRADAGIVDDGLQEMVRGYQMLADEDPLKKRVGVIINNRLDRLGDLLVHPWSISDFAFSGNSSRLASTNGTDQIILWDCEKFIPIANPFYIPGKQEESSKITALNLNQDGSYITCATSDGSIMVWEAVSGLQKCRIEFHKQMAAGPALIKRSLLSEPSDESVEASQARNKFVSIVDPDAQPFSDEAGQKPGAIQGNVSSLTFDNKNLLLVATDRGRLYRLNWTTQTTETIFEENVDGLFVSTGGLYFSVLYGSPQKQAVFSIEGAQSLNAKSRHDNVRRVELGKIPHFAICFSHDHTCVWDLISGAHRSMGNPQDAVVADGDYASFWNVDNGVATKWQITPDPQGMTFQQQKSYLLRGMGNLSGFDRNDPTSYPARKSKTGFSPGPKFVATSIASNVLRLHNLEDSKDSGLQLLTSTFWPSTMRARFSDDSRIVAFLVDSEVLGVWDTGTGQQLPVSLQSTQTIAGHVYLQVGQSSIWLRPDFHELLLEKYNQGRMHFLQKNGAGDLWAAVGNAQGIMNAVSVWSASSNKQVMFKAFNRTVRHMELARGLPLLLTLFASTDGRNLSAECRVWDINQQTSLLLERDAMCATLSENGRQVAVADSSGNVRIYDSRSGSQQFRNFPHASPIKAVKFDSTQQTLICGDTDGAIHFWDLQTSLPLSFPGQTTVSKSGGNSELRFEMSPNDKYLLAATGRSSAQLWTLSEKGYEEVLKRTQNKTRLATGIEGNTRTLDYKSWLDTIGQLSN